MKVIYKNGNMLNDDADILVNCVNSHTAYGGGLAGQFANKFPKNAEEYESACKRELMGDLNCIYYTFDCESTIIANILTMTDDMKGYYLRTLTGLKQLSHDFNHKSIAIPPCVCGIGGLDKKIIHKEILYIFKNCDVELRLYDFK